MHLESSVYDSTTLLTVSGHVSADDAPGLRDHLVAMLSRGRGDLLLDLRRAASVSDPALSALADARSRAKRLGRRIAVIDVPDGAALRGLQRRGMHLHVPVYLDVRSAISGMLADATARARRAVGATAAQPDAGIREPPAPGEDGEALRMVAQSGRTLWPRHSADDEPAGWHAPAGPAGPERHLRLRGGPLDGLAWHGAIDVGGRICCGETAWSPSHVYVVTPEIVLGAGGRLESIAVPAEF